MFGFLLLDILVFLAVFGFLVVLAEQERVGTATTLLVAAFVALWWFGKFNVATFALEHPVKFGCGVVGWFVIGTLYSMHRFDKLCFAEAERYQDDVKRYPGREFKKADYTPTVMQNKHRLTNWIVMWPPSAFWYYSRNILTNTVDFILRRLNGVYTRIAARHFDKLADHVPPATQGAKVADKPWMA